MFQSNNLDPLSLIHKQSDNQKLPFDLQAKSSVKVSIPVEDEDLQNDYEQPATSNVDNETSVDMLSRFRNYIKFHAIEPYDIWEGKKALQYYLFVDVMQKKIGYRFTNDEMFQLKTIAENDMISQVSFNGLDIWPQRSNSKVSLLTTLSQKSFFDIKKKRNSSVKNLLKVESRKSEEQQSMFDTKPFKKSGGDKSRMRTTCDQLTKTFLKSGFVTEECKDNKIQALREDLQMNALQKKWELVVMAGEMNKWINDSLTDHDRETNRIPAMFKVVNHAETFTIIKVDENKHEEVIPEVVFYKKYHALKKKQSTGKQVETKAISNAILGVLNINPSKGPVSKLNQRDKELNEALLHIMRIKNILEFQYKVLTQTAINT